MKRFKEFVAEEESIQQKMARQRAAREARDGTPEEVAEKKKQAAYEKTHRKMNRLMKSTTRLANQLTAMHKAAGRPLPK